MRAAERRPLWIVCLLLPLAALALWSSARLTWIPGPALPALVPLALLALAAIAAALALGPLGRRVVGVLVAALGLVPVVAPLLDGAPGWGQALAVTGGGLMVASGIVLLLKGHRMPLFGAKYKTPRAAAETEPDMWRALSEGDDPTAKDDRAAREG